ncbi:MAG: hypothetical protein LBL82_05485 [Oscillospiraceae bacterium]|jgi:hypothetical protein|nr:hypothetical protein [Oscillospiraceae bacterium]
MNKYIGSKCPVCDEEFTEKDDIVVCPHCGTPHHRSCYSSNGQCANDDLHAEDFIWVSEVAVPASDGIYQPKCEHCGAALEFGAQVCSHCGCPAGSGERQSVHESEGVPMPPAYQVKLPFGDTEAIGDATVDEVRRFTGSAAWYYVVMFTRLVKSKFPISFNLSAFIGNWAWFLLRKMYVLGAALAAVSIFATLYPIIFYQVATVKLGVTEITDVSQILQSGSVTLFLGSALTGLCSFLQLGVMILCGFFGNKLYMCFTLRKIRKIRKASKSEEEKNSLLARKGNISRPVFYGLTVAFFSFMFFLQSEYFTVALDFAAKYIANMF